MERNGGRRREDRARSCLLDPRVRHCRAWQKPITSVHVGQRLFMTPKEASTESGRVGEGRGEKGEGRMEREDEAEVGPKNDRNTPSTSRSFIATDTNYARIILERSEQL
ncbi:hypothetical protein KM043_007401 [Ampulex compressa]|nr:hypothetical protein KM043_007401 [Ampulex compressa]